MRSLLSSTGGGDRSTRSPLLSIVLTLLLVVSALGWYAAFLNLFSQPPQPRFDQPLESYDPAPMQESVAPEAVRSKQRAILEKGDRFIGDSGFYATEEFIKQTFQSAGLEVFEQEISTVAPRTRYSSISLVGEDEGGETEERPLEEVAIIPFLPNFLQPVVTPESGITGELVLISSDSLNHRRDFGGCIGLIDAREGEVDERFGFRWSRYAQLGIEALIIAHPGGLEQIHWSEIAAPESGIVSDVPVNFVRVAASKEIFRYIGMSVRLDTRVDFVNVPNRTVIGLLRAEKPAREALIIFSSYGACSILPDRAPGVLQAISPAVQVQLLKGLVAYRKTLTRDVIFVSSGARFMAEDGSNNLIRILQVNRQKGALQGIGREKSGANSSEQENPRLKRRHDPLLERLRKNQRQLENIEEILAAFAQPTFLAEPAETGEIIDEFDEEARRLFDEQVAYLLAEISFHRSEPLLRARLRFLKDPQQSAESESFRTFQAARGRYQEAHSASGYNLKNLLERKPDYVKEIEFRGRCQQWFEQLLDYHRIRDSRGQKELQLVRLFSKYTDLGILEANLVPERGLEARAEILGVGFGSAEMDPEVLGINRLVARSKERLSIGEELEIEGISRTQYERVEQSVGSIPNDSGEMWTDYGYPKYTFFNFQRRAAYDHHSDPTELPFMRDLRSIRHSLSVLGETVLAMAHGSGNLGPTTPVATSQRSFGGRVLAANVGTSIVPNYPLRNAIVACRPKPDGQSFSYPGYFKHLLTMTDPYGRFDLPHNSSDFTVSTGTGFNPVAAAYGEDGTIHYMKDEGEEGQRQFKSLNLDLFDRKAIGNVTIATFRGAPVALVDLINPQTLREYTGVRMISARRLAEIPKQCIFRGDGIALTFLQPDEQVFVELQAGAPANELVQVTRAFMLGRSESSTRETEREIEGDGYLVADHPMITDAPFEIARAMAAVNGRRLDLQNRYKMADTHTNVLHERMLERIEYSDREELSRNDSVRAAREAIIFATLNHPVLRQSITEAILGIIWYLALLVPFVFFFEKLLFCSPDVRKQIAAQMIIFLIVFSLLRLLHPAFAMVRSSLMILLGFIIILISSGISILFSSKFQENLEELRKQQGKLRGSRINQLGVAGAAFLLGLNNMHRRRLRTGLTCATLTLLMFAIICFTSVESDLVHEEFAVGKAAYQGVLIKRPLMQPITTSEEFAISESLGNRFSVAPRRFLVGKEDPTDKTRRNPELEMTYMKEGRERRISFDSIMQFTHAEPLREQIRFLSRPAWFTREDESRSEGAYPVIIPDRMAEQLGISPREVDNGGVTVNIGGRQRSVLAIFDPASLRNLRDLDGHDLLPFDIERMEVLVKSARGDSTIVAALDDPRISPHRIVLAPIRPLRVGVANAETRTASIAITMPGISYRDAREEIQSFLEQKGEAMYYGLDGVAYKGRRARESSIAGAVDLLIPLLIAALTVLNTLTGSVHERREEIYVYNSVGIAPRYVFFIFLAEAFVYLVVASVLGYLLSQGIGRGLTAFGLTGGLRMTFTSLSTIYASLALSAAVIVSTWFPARTAMAIAAPSEEAGWTLPEPVDHQLRLDLPFNFRPRGRIAILSFFHRYLLDHGEGSSGRFFAAPPSVALSRGQGAAGQSELLPEISTTVWLKPFDLAVSQRLTITLPEDPETGLFKARLTIDRLSGSREAWLRQNHSFVVLIRQHFLHWRAVTEEERDEMFVEAEALLRRNL